MLKCGTAVEADARDAGHREFDNEDITRLAGRIITGCTADRAHAAVGKGIGIEAGSRLGILVVPEADRVFGHRSSIRFEAKARLVFDQLPIEIGSPSMCFSLDVLVFRVPAKLISTIAESYFRSPPRDSPALAGK